MPIYEYECSKCGHVFEKIQRISDKPARTCPECKGRVRKLVSQSAFVLKGGGWYADGYSAGRKGASGGKGSKDSAPSKESKPKESKKSPAAKSASPST